jgi:hypothetical protein
MIKKNRRDVSMTLQDLKMLKKNVQYNPFLGHFYRKTNLAKPLTLCWSNKQATIPVLKDGRKKYFTAWRAAIYFAQGYYPTFEDAVVFEDGDNGNFRITNLFVCHPNDNEQTILDFATEHGLSPQTVNCRMKGAVRFERFIRNWKVYFYSKHEFIKRCGDLITKSTKVKAIDETEEDRFQVKRMDLTESRRGNKTSREFLKMWTGDMPKRWDMTLC